GFEQKIQRVVREHMKKYADKMETDLHGNLMVGINTKASRRIMLAGHCDQIGLIVKHISKEGYIHVAALGGIDCGVLLGAHVTVHGKDGSVPGVVGRKPTHQQSGDERSNLKLDIEKIWIDIGAKNQKIAEKLIEVGDPITLRPEVL